ncbi:MAG: peptidyl-prolyl cis-trans isomerase [Acidobacteriia bacterium]|nr:peptidyl-prolyl cis-trans isomerase [Terriglobia bacterium]
MKHEFSITVLLLVALGTASAQVASHAPTLVTKQPSPANQATGKPVARVNGAVLTDQDLLREMLAIFPYARQHNGFPKSQEAEIRKGALEMIIFEELVYQEAVRRKMTVPLARINRAEVDFREQFSSQTEFDSYLQREMRGSRQLLRERIRRSLLIESLLTTEVEHKSAVSAAELKAYYDKNPALFEHDESFSIQTISILPPPTASVEQLQKARKRADDALRQAKASKTYEEFGLLAEKLSEDDYRVNMGDHHAVDRTQLPPAVVQAALAMQPGQISDLIPIDQAYTIIRLNAHNAASKTEFAQVKDSLRKDLRKNKTNQLRANLDKKLRTSARVELF